MIDGMLDKAIEIEGLIRIIRDGEPSEEVYGLLKRKAIELLEDIEQRAKSKEQRTKDREQRAIRTENVGELPDAAVEMEEEADVMMGFAEDEVTKAETQLETSDYIKDSEEKDSEWENAKRENPENVAADLKSTSDEDDIMLFLDEDESKESEKDTTDKAKIASSIGEQQINDGKGASNLKSYFSLNDRFLYSRELFDNNMKAFDSTLKSLEGVRDFSAIEDYFYNELDWDRENPTVKSFMEKLKHNA